MELNRPSGYLGDLLDQPAAIQRTINFLRGIKIPRGIVNKISCNGYKQVVLTGMGASYFSLIPIMLRLIYNKVPVCLMETSELIHHAPILLNPDNLIIVVSQSGSSAELVRLLDCKSDDITILGITNSPKSPLAQNANFVVLTKAGEEISVSCKTYLASIAALTWLDAVLFRNDPNALLDEVEEIIPAIDSYLDHHTEHVKEWVTHLQKVRNLVLVGRGVSLSAVGAGALFIKEAARFPTEGMSSAAFRHGPLEIINSTVFVLVYSGSEPTVGLNRHLFEDIREMGGRASLICPGMAGNVFTLPKFSEITQPYVEILPAQMASIALARMQGHEAGHFERAHKITRTE